MELSGHNAEEARRWGKQARELMDSTPLEPLLRELVDFINEGLELWPPGLTAICPINYEPYRTYVIGYRVDGRTTDRDLIDAVKRTMAKHKEGAKYVSWRLLPTLGERNTLEDQAGGGAAMSGDRGFIGTINQVERFVRFRVLITAKTNDPEEGKA